MAARLRLWRKQAGQLMHSTLAGLWLNLKILGHSGPLLAIDYSMHLIFKKYQNKTLVLHAGGLHSLGFFCQGFGNRMAFVPRAHI